MAIGKAGRMATLYILRSLKSGRYYIGSTNNIERRLAEHGSGKTKSLRNLLPVELAFKKDVDSIVTARGLERKLKKYKNRGIIDQVIAEQELKMGL